MVIFTYLMETSFSDWLQRELRERNMTQADLARLSGITTAQISRIISESRGIGPNAVNSIARALDLPPEEVYRAAGLLPPAVNLSPLDLRIIHLLSDLPNEEDKQEVLDFIEMRHRRILERGKRVLKKTGPLSPQS